MQQKQEYVEYGLERGENVFFKKGLRLEDVTWTGEDGQERRVETTADKITIPGSGWYYGSGWKEYKKEKRQDLNDLKLMKRHETFRRGGAVIKEADVYQLIEGDMIHLEGETAQMAWNLAQKWPDATDDALVALIKDIEQIEREREFKTREAEWRFVKQRTEIDPFSN